MELSYATETLRGYCIGGVHAGWSETETSLVLAVLADLRAAPALHDAPLRLLDTASDEVMIPIRGTNLAIVATIAHLRGTIPNTHTIRQSGRLQLLDIVRRRP